MGVRLPVYSVVVAGQTPGGVYPQLLVYPSLVTKMQDFDNITDISIMLECIKQICGSEYTLEQLNIIEPVRDIGRSDLVDTNKTVALYAYNTNPLVLAT